MNYNYWEVDVEHNGAVRVDLSGTEANVLLMDHSNFNSYKSGGRYRYFGGHYKQSPAVIRPPNSGRWFVVINLGGYGGSVNARVSVV